MVNINNGITYGMTNFFKNVLAIFMDLILTAGITHVNFENLSIIITAVDFQSCSVVVVFKGPPAQGVPKLGGAEPPACASLGIRSGRMDAILHTSVFVICHKPRLKQLSQRVSHVSCNVISCGCEVVRQVEDGLRNIKMSAI